MFRGAYGGKDVFPLYVGIDSAEAHLGPVVPSKLAGDGIGPDEIAQYLYGIGGTAAFSEGFTEELAIAAGPVHLPITKDRALFDAVATLGKELLAWHTWGERYTDQPIPLGPATEFLDRVLAGVLFTAEELT